MSSDLIETRANKAYSFAGTSTSGNFLPHHHKTIGRNFYAQFGCDFSGAVSWVGMLTRAMVFHL